MKIDQKVCSQWLRWNRAMTWPIIQVRSTLKWNRIVITNSTRYGLWRRPDKAMTLLIVHVRSMSKSKLNYHYQSIRMRSITKTKQDNYMIDYTSVISVEYNTEVSRKIGLCAVYDEDEIGQWRDRLYRCDLCRIRYLSIKTYQIMCGLWKDEIVKWCDRSYRFTLCWK